MIFYSCELAEKLDDLPPSTLIVENAITSEATAETAVNGIYSYLGDYGEMILFMITDQALRANLVTESAERSSYELELTALELPDDWRYTKNTWVEIFSIVNAANNVIQQLEQFQDDDFSSGRREQMLGEAYFMRAWANLYQMKMFGYFWDVNSEYGPIIRLVPSGLNHNAQARSNVADGYKQILMDLRFASEHAPNFYSVYKASKDLAKAYIVETLLMRGEPGDFEEAAQIADEVINSSSFTLESTFAEVYSNGYESSELMFSRDIKPENEADYAVNNNFSNIYEVLGKKRNAPTDTYFRYVTPQDTRYEVIIDTVTAADGVTYLNTWAKHFEVDQDVPMRYMRLTQMYLYKAEALAKSGASVADVLVPINVLRNRAGMPEYDATMTNSNDLQQIIFNEMVIEVGVENGSEFFAAIRMKDGSGERIFESLNPAFQSESQLVLPIPADELIFNPEMIPNP